MKQKPYIIEHVGFDFSWDEKKVWQLDVPVEAMNIEEVAWHLDVPFLWSKPDGYYDINPRWVIEQPEKYPDEYRRTQRADTSYPIDIMQWRGRWVILDGLHRLMKLAQSDVEVVRVRKISPDDIDKIKKQASYQLDTEAVQTLWPIGNVRHSKVIKQGGRIIYDVTAESDEYICKVASTGRDESGVRTDLETLAYIDSQDFRAAPRIIRTKNDQLYARLRDRFVYMLEKVNGTEPAGTSETWAALGEITGLLHTLPLGPQDTHFTQAAIIPDLEARAHQFSFAEEYRALLGRLVPLDDLPRAIIHTDIGPHNSIQKSDGTIVLVDWDDAGNGQRILDIAFPLLCQFVDLETGAFREDRARAFYTAYAEHISLTPPEISSLFSAGLFYALMYLEYGDTEKTWRAMNEALRNREAIEAFLRTIFLPDAIVDVIAKEVS